MVWLPIVLAAFFLVSCGRSGSSSGGGGGGGSSPTVENTPPGTYTIVITGAANGITHNAAVYVVVH